MQISSHLSTLSIFWQNIKRCIQKYSSKPTMYSNKSKRFFSLTRKNDHETKKKDTWSDITWRAIPLITTLAFQMATKRSWTGTIKGFSCLVVKRCLVANYLEITLNTGKRLMQGRNHCLLYLNWAIFSQIMRFFSISSSYRMLLLQLQK